VTVSANETAYVAGRALALTVRGPSAFCGFLVVSEDADGNRVGSFAPSAEAAVREGCAGEPNATATHTAQFDNQTSLLLFWTASATVNYGPVTFRLVVLSGRRGAAASQLIYWPAPITVPSAQGPKPTAAPMPVDTTCATPPPPLVGCPEAQAGIVPWSVWRANATADDWQNVTVPAGSIVLLDVTPPKINQLDVRGQLVVTPAAAARVALRARFIYVHACAHLWVGSRDCPVLGAVDIELHGDPAPKVNPAGFGTKVLAGLPGSQIDIHGRPTSFAWTQLGAHAVKGSRRIELAETPRGWGRNDEIVIASTQFIAGNDVSRIGRTERRTVVDVVNRTLTWNGAALLTTHYGAVYVPAGAPAEHAIDMRAEVALLTRNVKIHGDVSGRSYDAGWGGHVMVIGNAELRVQDAELFDMGQAGELARYPIHFHVTRNNSKSYVVRNSIHDTFQRCVTVHGTNRLLVQGNAAYNNRGHCYFIEDADEVDNVFDRNLGIDPQPHTLLRSDATPAVFWITHPGNHFYRNRAVGGAFGFWYAMPQHPTGLATNADTEHLHWPIHAPLGDFVDNAAHGQRAGLFVDRGLAPTAARRCRGVVVRAAEPRRRRRRGGAPQNARPRRSTRSCSASGWWRRLSTSPRTSRPSLACGRAAPARWCTTRASPTASWARRCRRARRSCRRACSSARPTTIRTSRRTTTGATCRSSATARTTPASPTSSSSRRSTTFATRRRASRSRVRSTASACASRAPCRARPGPNTLPPFNLLLANTAGARRQPGALLPLRRATASGQHGRPARLRPGDQGHGALRRRRLADRPVRRRRGRLERAAAPLERVVRREARIGTRSCATPARAPPTSTSSSTPPPTAWDDANGVSPTLVEDALLYIYRLGAEPANMTQRPLVSGLPCPTAQEPNRICTSVRAVWNTNVLSGFEYAISLLNARHAEALPRRRHAHERRRVDARARRRARRAARVYNADGKPLPSAAAAANLNAQRAVVLGRRRAAPLAAPAGRPRHLRVGRRVGNTYAVELWNVGCASTCARAPAPTRRSTRCARRRSAARRRAPALAASAPLGGLAPAPGPSRCGWTSQFTQVTPSAPRCRSSCTTRRRRLRSSPTAASTGVSVATNAGVVPGGQRHRRRLGAAGHRHRQRPSRR
jgi:hypothetical protein